jgi:hypothetical protein
MRGTRRGRFSFPIHVSSSLCFLFMLMPSPKIPAAPQPPSARLPKNPNLRRRRGDESLIKNRPQSPERARPRAQQRKNHCKCWLASITNRTIFPAFAPHPLSPSALSAFSAVKKPAFTKSFAPPRGRRPVRQRLL